MKAPRSIGVIRFSSIGDIVLTIPALREMKQRWPEASITLITKESFRSLMEPEPSIDRIETLGKGESVNDLIRRLSERSFDLIIDLHDNFRSHAIARNMHCPVMRYRKGRIRRMSYLWFKKRESVTPIWKRYCAAFGGTGEPASFDLAIDPAVEESIRGKVPAEPFLLIAPGSTWATKEWPIEHYAALAKLLANHPFPIVVIGGDKDRAVQNTLAESLGDRLIPLAGTCSIPESAAIVRQAACVLTVDTGMMHIASSYDKPMVVLFGSTVQEFGFFPASNRATVLEQPLSCRPCSHTGKRTCPKNHFRCMKEISPELVYETLLSKGSVSLNGGISC